jgi:hypothetical protein
MAQATSSLALLPVNELPPPPSLEQELAKALEDIPGVQTGSQVTQAAPRSIKRINNADSNQHATMPSPWRTKSSPGVAKGRASIAPRASAHSSIARSIAVCASGHCPIARACARQRSKQR